MTFFSKSFRKSIKKLFEVWLTLWKNNPQNNLAEKSPYVVLLFWALSGF